MSDDTEYWRIQAADVLAQLHEAERENERLSAQLADVMRAGDMEHARMAAIVEACEATAAFIESYTPNSYLAQMQPAFYGQFRATARTRVLPFRPCAPRPTRCWRSWPSCKLPTPASQRSTAAT